MERASFSVGGSSSSTAGRPPTGPSSATPTAAAAAASAASSLALPSALLGNRPPAALEHFPPSLEKVAELLAETPSDAAREALDRWRSQLLEVLEWALRGSPVDAAPVEEVWHWLSLSERLTRYVGFCEHSNTTKLVSQVESSGPEGRESAERWASALKSLRRAARESSGLAGCLRIVEGPLQRLDDDSSSGTSSLPGLVKSLMKSLKRIQTTSSHLKDERMAQLLRKILRSLVARASKQLTGPFEVAAPRGGLRDAFERCGTLREVFQAFLDLHFLQLNPAATGPPSTPDGNNNNNSNNSNNNSNTNNNNTSPFTPAPAWPSPRHRESEGGSLSARQRRPSPSPMSSSGGTPLRSARKREGSSGGGTPSNAFGVPGSGSDGWWRAATRVSLEQAEHCERLCKEVGDLIFQWAQLKEVLPKLNSFSPELVRDIEAFQQLHSGIKAGPPITDLLELRYRSQAQGAVEDVQRRLAGLRRAAEALGVRLPETPSCMEDYEEDVEAASPSQPRPSSSSGADVLVLAGSVGGIDQLLKLDSSPASKATTTATTRGGGGGGLASSSSACPQTALGAAASSCSAAAAASSSSSLPSSSSGLMTRELGPAAQVQASLDSMQADLQSFSDDLEATLAKLSKKSSNGAAASVFFRPPSRGVATPMRKEANAGGGGGEPNGGAEDSRTTEAPPVVEEEEEDDEASERAAALEVAKRSSWYFEPPPVIKEGVELIQVNTKITTKIIHRVPSRPRTAHPLLTTTRPLQASTASGSDEGSFSMAAPPTAPRPSSRTRRPRPATAAASLAGAAGGGGFERPKPLPPSLLDGGRVIEAGREPDEQQLHDVGQSDGRQQSKDEADLDVSLCNGHSDGLESRGVAADGASPEEKGQEKQRDEEGARDEEYDNNNEDEEDDDDDGGPNPFGSTTMSWNIT